MRSSKRKLTSRKRLLAPATAALALTFPAYAGAMGNPGVAALQVALQARGLYAGTIDGFRGPGTIDGVRTLQERAGLPVDGIAGPMTRRALGPLGRPDLGRRALRIGAVGWDVSQLQFLVAWHGFPSGTIDGGLGPRTDRALRRFQRFAGLVADGVAGPATIRRLRGPLPRSPLRLAAPIGIGVADRFGPRGARFHSGIDFPASFGAAVHAARSGSVRSAGWDSGGYGYTVVVDHGLRVHTLYAHLSRIDVRRGQRVATGSRVGAVGSSGASTGPHLHFELRYRGAAVDPLTALR